MREKHSEEKWKVSTRGIGLHVLAGMTEALGGNGRGRKE
jgi:hypothetical protein